MAALESIICDRIYGLGRPVKHSSPDKPLKCPITVPLIQVKAMFDGQRSESGMITPPIAGQGGFSLGIPWLNQ